MKNWIVLGVALLGGVVGGGTVSVLLREPGPSAVESERSWFCVQLGDKLTSCAKDIGMCRRQMPKTDLPCVMLPLAWCGTYHCTATREYCETISPDNGLCELRRP